jgi:hypothetical protein
MIKWCKTHAMAACFYSILLALGSKLIRRQQGAPDLRSIWRRAQMLLNARRVGRHDQLRPRPDPLQLLPRRSLSPRCLPLRAEETTLESKRIRQPPMMVPMMMAPTVAVDPLRRVDPLRPLRLHLHRLLLLIHQKFNTLRLRCKAV